MASRNGFFGIEVKNDGTYLVLVPQVEMGLPIDPNEVESYLVKMDIQHEKSSVYDAIRDITEKCEIKLNDNHCEAIDEYANVYIDSDRMSATARFYMPSGGGKQLCYNDVITAMTHAGVRFGADEQAINSFLADRCYCTPYIVAQALLPQEGEDAVVTYNFNTDVSAKPRQNEDGSVDFHHLDNIIGVEKGQLLATVKTAVQGKPGIDVTGKPIKPRAVSVQFLRMSKNTFLSEDGCQLFAKVNGHVTLVEGQIFVSDTYVVPANVDASTGDIMYQGNVEVSGNVMTGYRIEAEGDVVVNGIVEGAEIVAGGQIILKRGIQGMGKGRLRAGKNVVSRFIESAEVIAGGYIHTDSIMHSNVEAGDEITVGGKKGFITGGSIKASTYIKAKTAGSVMGTVTVMEVGTMTLAAELKKLEKEKSDLVANIEKASKVLSFITRKIREGEKLSDERFSQFTTLSAQKTEMEGKLFTFDEKIEQLRATIDCADSGYILVDDNMYPGCKVTISNVTSFIRTVTKHCRLVRDGADIRTKAY